jgi:YHS domain-containing protein
VLNVLAAVVFVALMGLTIRRGATDPTCGMTVDKGKALRLERDGHTYYFCSEHCRATFSGGEQPHDGGHAHDHDHAAQGSGI